MRPGHLAAHLAAFEANPALGLVASAADVIDDAGREIPASVVGRGGCGDRDRTFAPGEFARELAIENPLRCSAVSLNAETHAEVGGFDPSFRYVVDWDFWLRVARRRPVAWLARPTVAIRWHLSSETHRFKSGTADLDETTRLLETLYQEDGQRFTDADRLRRKADRRLARAFLNRAYEALKGGDSRLARDLPRPLDQALAGDPGHHRPRPEACRTDGRSCRRPESRRTMVGASRSLIGRVNRTGRRLRDGSRGGRPRRRGSRRPGGAWPVPSRRWTRTDPSLWVDDPDQGDAGREEVFDLLVQLLHGCRSARSPRRPDRERSGRDPSPAPLPQVVRDRVNETSGMRTLLGSSGKIW